MLHIVPILCLLMFVALVEYRLKKHIDRNDVALSELQGEVRYLRMLVTNVEEELYGQRL